MTLDFDLGYSRNLLYANVRIPLPEKGVVSFIGDNGSGKSTLYKTLLGIVLPLRGQVPGELIERAAVVSDYVNIPGEVTVQDLFNLLGKEKTGFAANLYPDLHEYILTFVSQRICTLSSGQRRIVEIYTVLASGKTIIILDEAGNSLDFKNRQLFLSHVKSLASQNVLFFHTSHELEDVAFLKGRVYGLFKDEKIIQEYTGECTTAKLREFLGYEVSA